MKEKEGPWVSKNTYHILQTEISYSAKSASSLSQLASRNRVASTCLVGARKMIVRVA